MNLIQSLERRLCLLEKLLLSALLAVMVCLSFLQLVLRGFSAGMLWADTFLRHLVLFVGFLGGALAAAEDKQFAMDAAGRLFTGRLKYIVHLVTNLFASGVCAALAKASATFLKDEYRAGGILFTAGGLHVPLWIFQVILPAGFALLLIHYLLRSAASALELRP